MEADKKENNPEKALQEEATVMPDPGSNGSGNAEAQKSAGGELEKEVARLNNELLYQRAEQENYKRRILKEQDQAIKFGNEKIVRELLGVVDLLERGISHGQPLKAKPQISETEFSNFFNGIDITYRQLTQLLGRFGVEFIGSIGEKFDPSRHEAISTVEAGPDKSGSVVEVLQKGSLFHGRLLAPAKVIVGKS